jgi:hypothetical protein
VDIAPTILDIAKAKQETTMDGTLFWKHVQGQADPKFTKHHDLLIYLSTMGKGRMLVAWRIAHLH